MKTFATLTRAALPAHIPRRPTPARRGCNPEIRRILHAPRLQPKLTVGAPNDAYEREADRVADQVLRMPEPERRVQRVCAGCEEELQREAVEVPEEEEELQRQPLEEPEEEEELQAEEVPGQVPAIDRGLEGRIQALRGGGRPLAVSERAFFETRFGADFAGVRLHTGGEAAQLAQEVSARAFTVGRDVVFGAGEYAPASESGRHLLAHELTHVVQQRGSPVQRLQRWSFGTSPATGMVVVPATHRPRVTRAMGIIEGVAKDKRCKEYFKDNCTGGAATELQDAIDNAEVYSRPGRDSTFGTSVARTSTAIPRKIAYNDVVFDFGRWKIAQTLLHELFHTCIIGVIPKEEEVAEIATDTCRLYTPFVTSISPRSGPVGTVVTIRGIALGPRQDAVDKITFGGVDAGRASHWDFVGGGSSAVEIRIAVPAGASTGPLIVWNNGIASNQFTFTVT